MNPSHFLSFVLEDAAMEVVSHADIESAAGTTLHDVHVVAMFTRHELAINCHPEIIDSAKRTQCEVEGSCVFSI